MTNTQQNIIVGFREDGKRVYFDGAKFTEDKTAVYLYDSHDDALSDWFDINKRPYKRVFVCLAESLANFVD